MNPVMVLIYVVLPAWFWALVYLGLQRVWS